MNGGAATEQPRERAGRWRSWCLFAAVIGVVATVAPPLSGAARHTEYAAALQFSLVAIVVPALVALGAPWRLLRLASDGSPDRRNGAVDRLADRRRRHRELPRSLAFIAADLGVVVAWHAPGAVAAVALHAAMVALEALSLIVLGLGLWLELVTSPPLVPRSGYLRRAVLAAFVMWAFWILAYVVGLSNHDFYRTFDHVSGGLSSAADQQIASAVVWFVAAASFIPVVFWNALMWLKTDEDPDAELLALRRAERRGMPPVARRGGAAPTP
jgi:cytochrome c oxidase assembly factor CtaG